MRRYDDRIVSDELIADFRLGVEEAFEHLWARYRSDVERDVRRVTTEYDDIQELLQDISIAVYSARHTFAGTGDIGAWIHGVAQRRCLQWIRTRERRRRRDDTFAWIVATDLSEPTNLLSDDGWSTMSRLAVRALADLTPRQRTVVLRRAVYGDSVAEVGLRLKCAAGTVKSTYHTALGRLRQRLETSGQNLEGVEKVLMRGGAS